MDAGPPALLTVDRVPREAPAGVPLEAAAVGATAALVCVVGTDGRILLVNAALERATGWASAEVVGRPFWDVLVVPEEVALAEDCVARAVLTGQAAPQEGDWLDRWGGRRRVAMALGVARDEQDVPYAVVFVGLDVTERRLAEAQLRVRATRDALTGLLNRDSFLTALHQELQDEASVGCGVLFADLDGFKAANDIHGHQVGDLLLRAVGERLTAVVGPGDLVCRYGGDEFVVLRRGADAAGVHQVRCAMQAAVDAPFVTPQGLVHLGLSVGTALGRHGDAAESLVAAADRHMYGVKTTRRSERHRAAAG